MKPRTVRRLCLVDGMNLDHIEGWLESMAARGLHYDHSDAFLFHFRRGEPAAVRSRLEPRGTGNQTPRSCTPTRWYGGTGWTSWQGWFGGSPPPC